MHQRHFAVRLVGLHEREGRAWYVVFRRAQRLDHGSRQHRLAGTKRTVERHHITSRKRARKQTTQPLHVGRVVNCQLKAVHDV